MSDRRLPEPTISEDEFARLCDFFYRRTGMVFTEAKRYYIERRVFERMTATGAASFSQYFARMRMDLDAEIEQVINAFTVNETYFYREDHQFRCLTTDLLRLRAAQKAQGEAIRLWSVPCSTGEEPYSIAMWLLENWPEVDHHDIEILGSDIDTRALNAAREGYYGARALSRLTPDLVDRYFEKVSDERWQAAQELRESVAFSPVNLIEGAETRALGVFDVIFCRNVLIYFNDESRRVAAENLFECLKPGGFLCLGHTESMSRISPLFEVRRYADAIVYQKPGEPRRG
jgi:chemotaxis protein methyltransferase CheR